MNKRKRPSGPRRPMPIDQITLTKMQMATLDALVAECSYKSAADRLGISPSTVKFHAEAAREKMGEQTTMRIVVRWALFKAGAPSN